MSWKIRIPFRRRDETLTVAAGRVRHLPGSDEDRAATRQLMISAGQAGHRTVGSFLDHLESLTDDQRRELLDAARGAVGCKSSWLTDLDNDLDERAQQNRARMATDRRPLRLAISESGAIVDLTEMETEGSRVAAQQESLARRRASELAEAAAGADQQRAFESARDRRLDSELPPHLRPPQ